MRVELTEAEAALLRKFQAAIGEVQYRMRGALEMALASRGLEGSWSLSEDGSALLQDIPRGKEPESSDMPNG